MSSPAPLFEPLQVGPLTLKTRIIGAAMTRSRAVPTNVPNDVMLEYYRQRAKGGCSLMVTEACLVAQQGTEWPNAPGIWNQDHIDGWKKIVDAVHAEGEYIYCQLWHAGRLSHPDMSEQIAAGVPVYGPSAIAANGGKFRLLPGAPAYQTPTEIVDPTVIVEQFRQGAVNAKAAGFDGVELHGANGYLIHQFLDSTSNLRTDKWGGSVENRARFPLEVLKAVSEVFGADRVAIKLTPAGGYNDMGMPLDDTIATFSYVIGEANKLNIAYICICRYVAFMDPAGRGTPHDVIEVYRNLITSPTRAVVNTGFTPEEGSSFVAQGKADAVQFGMLWITHPDLTKRVQHGKPLDNVLQMQHLYGSAGSEEQQAVGYIDYPGLSKY